MKNSKFFEKNIALLLAVLLLGITVCSCQADISTEPFAPIVPSEEQSYASSENPSSKEDGDVESLESPSLGESPSPSGEPVEPSPSPTPSLSKENADVALKYIVMQDTLNDVWDQYGDWVANAVLVPSDIPNRCKSIFDKTLVGVRLSWIVWSEWGFVDKDLMGDEYEIVLCYRQSPKDNSDKEDRWFCIEEVDFCTVSGVEGKCFLGADVTNLAFVDVLEEWCAEKDEVQVDIQMWILYDGESEGLIFDFCTTKRREIASGFVEGILEETIKIDKESLDQAKEWIEEFRSNTDQSE